MSKFLLIINGPMCSGKSTISKLLTEGSDDIFRSSYDALKWSIENYSGDNPEHKKQASDVTFEALKDQLKIGKSIVVDGGFGKFRDRYKEIAKEFNLKYISINIEAPKDVLEKRFLERVEGAKEKGRKLSVTTLDRFNDRYNWYLEENKDYDAITFDSGVMSIDKISANIIKLINL